MLGNTSKFGSLAVMSWNEYVEFTKRNCLTTPIGFTHDGKCHADEVFAAYIYMLYCFLVLNESAVTIVRTSELAFESLPENCVVFDISGKFDNVKFFDHHQTGGAGSRRNGIPYSSAGLLWRKYGHEVVKALLRYYNMEMLDENAVWSTFDCELVQSIDGIDNGLNHTLPREKKLFRDFTFSKLIGQCNSNFRGEAVDSNHNFTVAIDATEFIFFNMFKETTNRLYDLANVENNIDRVHSTNNVIVFKHYLHWKEWLFSEENYEKTKNVKFIIYHDDERKAFKWQAIEDRKTGELRAIAPPTWRGKTNTQANELEKITGVKGALFCHNTGYTGGAKTQEGCLKMVELMLDTG